MAARRFLPPRMYAGRVTASLNQRAPFNQFCASRRYSAHRAAGPKLITFSAGQSGTSFSLPHRDGFPRSGRSGCAAGTHEVAIHSARWPTMSLICAYFPSIGAPDVTTVVRPARQPVGWQTPVQIGRIIFTVNRSACRPCTGSAVMVSRLAVMPSKVGGQQQLNLTCERVIRRF